MKSLLLLFCVCFAFTIIQANPNAECDKFFAPKCDEPDNDNGVVKVALLVPSTTRKVQFTNAESLPIYQKLMKSFKNTYSPEFQYHLYVGYDKGDRFYDNPENLASLKKAIVDMQAGWTEGNLHFTAVEHKPLTQIWNDLFKQAYDEGNHYFYQTGDDVELQTPGWTKTFVEKLRANPLRKNLGIVGPGDSKNPQQWQEEGFVHRQHMNIFGYFFDPAFTDISCDVWSSQIYGDNSWILKEVLVDNSIRARYKPNPGKSLVCSHVKCGRRHTCAYLQHCAAGASTQDFCNRMNHSRVIEALMEMKARSKTNRKRLH